MSLNSLYTYTQKYEQKERKLHVNSDRNILKINEILSREKNEIFHIFQQFKLLLYSLISNFWHGTD